MGAETSLRDGFWPPSADLAGCPKGLDYQVQRVLNAPSRATLGLKSGLKGRDRFYGGIHMYERVSTRAKRTGCVLFAAIAVTGGTISTSMGRYEGAATPLETHLVQLQAVASSIALGTNPSEGTHTGSLVEGDYGVPALETADTPALRSVAMAANAATDAQSLGAAVGSRLEAFVAGAGITLTGIVMTPLWYLATPITLPLSYLVGSFSAMYGNDRLRATLNFYALPLQLIFVGIKLMLDPPTAYATAAIQPAGSQEPLQDLQESPEGSQESPAATTKPAAERFLSPLEDRPKDEPSTTHRASTLPLKREALSVPVPYSISPESPTESGELGELDAPTQNSEPEQSADLAATEQRTTSGLSRSGSNSTTRNNKAVRSR